MHTKIVNKNIYIYPQQITKNSIFCGKKDCDFVLFTLSPQANVAKYSRNVC